VSGVAQLPRFLLDKSVLLQPLSVQGRLSAAGLLLGRVTGASECSLFLQEQLL
jgi:hypothetical protein